MSIRLQVMAINHVCSIWTEIGDDKSGRFYHREELDSAV